MRVAITPATAARIDAVMLADDPVYSERVPGGLSTATVNAILDQQVAGTLRDAAIEIQPLHGPPWLGLVDTVSVNAAGVTTLECVGTQAALQRLQPRPALYCDTAVSEWQERPVTGRDEYIRAGYDQALIRFGIEAGHAYTSGRLNGVYREIPSTTASRVTFTYSLPANFKLILYRGTRTTPAPSDGTVGSFSAAWDNVTNNGGAASGNITVDISATHDLLRFDLVCTGNTTPGSDAVATITNLKVYGVAGVTSCTVSTIASDIIGRLPAWVLPAGADYRRWMDSNTATVEPFASDDLATTEQDLLSDLLAYTDWEFGFWPRLVNGSYYSVPVLRAPDTAVAYQAFADGTAVTADFTADGTAQDYTGIRVIYDDEDGKSRYLDKAVTGNWLADISHARWRVVNVATSSTTTAQAVADAYAALASPVQGSAEIRGPITSGTGGTVYPTEIEAGRIMRIHDQVRGPIEARIVSVEKHGDHYARVEFDNTPARLEAMLARLERLRR